MSEIQSLAAPKASFDRRSVVKTAAWSVPVIAAAIAAPAAAASVVTPPSGASAIFPNAQSATFYKVTDPTNTGQVRVGDAPVSFSILNAGSQISGLIKIGVKITPIAPAVPGVGFATLGPASKASSGFVGNVFDASYTYANGISSKGLAEFTFGGLHYSGKSNDIGGNYKIVLTLAIPGRLEDLVIDSTTLRLGK